MSRSCFEPDHPQHPARLRRRSFLKGLAASTVAAPLLGSLGARAQTSYPQRLLIWFTPNGTNPDVWFPTPGAGESDFGFSFIHQPMAAFRDHLLFTSGINMESLQVGPGEPHQRGMGAVLTGTHLQEGDFVGGDGTLAGWGNGKSVDQEIADHVGQGTPYKSLELGVRVLGSEVRHRINYAGPAQPLPPQASPRQVWNQLFADLSANPSETLLAKQRRERILQAARAQFATFHRRMSQADREKLEQHHAMVVEMEQRLFQSATVGEHCQQPNQPAFMDAEHENNMDEVLRDHIDLATMALACDMTRVITIQCSSGANNIRFPHLSSTQDDHQLSHAGAADTAAQQDWANRKRWYAEQFATLLAKLDAIPEGDGTLLDHTLIFWCSELAQGNTHSHANMPFLLAGGGGGIQMGRYVQYAGARHNDLLVSLMNALGVAGNTWGDPAYCTGPLAGLV